MDPEKYVEAWGVGVLLTEGLNCGLVRRLLLLGKPTLASEAASQQFPPQPWQCWRLDARGPYWWLKWPLVYHSAFGFSPWAPEPCGVGLLSSPFRE